MLWMGKVEQGATFSNLETGIKEQLAGQPPWIKQGNLAKDLLVFKHLYKSLVKYRSNCLPPLSFSSLLNHFQSCIWFNIMGVCMNGLVSQDSNKTL